MKPKSTGATSKKKVSAAPPVTTVSSADASADSNGFFLLDLALDGYLLLEQGAKVAAISPVACRLLGYAAAETQGQQLDQLLSDADPTTLADLVDQILNSSAADKPRRDRRSLTCRRKDGRELALEISLTRNPSSSTQVLALLRDISEHAQAIETLRRQEAKTREDGDRFRHLTGLAADSFWEQDDQLCFTFTSAGFLDKDGRSPLDFLGKQRHEVSHVKVGSVDWTAHQADLDARRPFRGFEYAQAASDGSYRWVSSSGDPLFDSDKRFIGYRGVTRDMTKRKRQEKELIRQANYDALTGLANRNLLRDRLARAMVRGARAETTTALLLIDLDGFKHINDSFGHAFGDKVLREIAGRLMAAVRAEDTVARLGGDEFVVVLESMTDEDAICALASKLLQAIGAPIHHAGQEMVFSGSVGISLHPGDSTDADVLIRNADSAMYEAKARGRDRFHFYTDELNERAVRYVSLLGNLRRALAEGQFWLSYQPIIDGTSGKLRGAEALIRWTNSDNVLLMPEEFIPTAEESGLIVPIGEWTLRETCNQIQAWKLAGLPVVPVAVNLSARQFFQKNLTKVIAGALESAGNLDPSLLHVEVTESVVMQDAKRTAEQLEEIRALGVDISIDDFGTGYSSLAYLRNFPVRHIKIDRSFVHGLPNNPNDAAIVSAVTALAHALGLKVVAEGVEHVAQMDYLRGLGCDRLQGFHFAKPMTAGKFGDWLTNPGGPQVS